MPRRVALRLFAFVDSMDEKKAVRDGRPIVRSIGQTFMPRPRDFFFFALGDGPVFWIFFQD